MTTDKKKTEEKKSMKRTIRGVVVSDKMTDTVVVAVTRYEKHPKYKKYVKNVKKYHAHDKGDNFKVGDKVEIQETTPISKTKKFIVITK